MSWVANSWCFIPLKHLSLIKRFSRLLWLGAREHFQEAQAETEESLYLGWRRRRGSAVSLHLVC